MDKLLLGAALNKVLRPFLILAAVLCISCGQIEPQDKPSYFGCEPVDQSHLQSNLRAECGEDALVMRPVRPSFAGLCCIRRPLFSGFVISHSIHCVREDGLVFINPTAETLAAN